MQEVSVVGGCGDTEHILEGLSVDSVHWKRFNLEIVSLGLLDRVKRRMNTILIEASVRLMKVGMTSPSSPAASNWAASHKERTVPTSCAKDSFQTRSVLGLPP